MQLRRRLNTLTITCLLSFTSVSAKAESTDTTAIPSDPSSILTSFETLFGVTKGKRRNHTKGFCFEGTLVPTKVSSKDSIHRLSDSSLFQSESKVIGRLSHKGGNNHAADDKPGEYGLGLSITTIEGQTHLMSMNTLDFFPVATPEAFAQLMHAKTLGSDAVKKFKAGNKDLQRFKAHEATKNKTLTPYEGQTFNSINSFYLVNAEEQKTAIRWSFKPTMEQKIVVEPNENFFFENIKENLKNNGVSWNMLITVANTNDAVDNAAIPWAGKHKEYTPAKLVLNSVSSEQDGKCDRINYDPLVLADGFTPSSDPLLQARRSSYAIGFGKRLTEE